MKLKNPGITWPSYAHDRGSTSWAGQADERDRIDLIFHKKGPEKKIKTIYAAIVGPRISYKKNKPDTSFTEHENFIADSLPWPSDHKGVFAKVCFMDSVTNINNRNTRALTNTEFRIDNLRKTIQYTLQKPSQVSVNMYDINGKKIKTIMNEFQSINKYSVNLELYNYAKGIYFYTLQIDGRMHSIIKFFN